MCKHTVDGQNPANQLRLVVIPLFARLMYPRWLFGISSIDVVSALGPAGVQIVILLRPRTCFGDGPVP